MMQRLEEATAADTMERMILLQEMIRQDVRSARQLNSRPAPFARLLGMFTEYTAIVRRFYVWWRESYATYDVAQLNAILDEEETLAGKIEHEFWWLYKTYLDGGPMRYWYTLYMELSEGWETVIHSISLLKESAIYVTSQEKP
jgi:hypothetical protein